MEMKRRSFIFGSFAAIAAAAMATPINAIMAATAETEYTFGMIKMIGGKASMLTDSGWVECFGQKLIGAVYPELARVLAPWQAPVFAGEETTPDIEMPILTSWEDTERTNVAVSIWNNTVKTPLPIDEPIANPFIPVPDAVTGNIVGYDTGDRARRDDAGADHFVFHRVYPDGPGEDDGSGNIFGASAYLVEYPKSV